MSAAEAVRLGVRATFALALAGLLAVAGGFAGVVVSRLVSDEAVRLVAEQHRLRAELLATQVELQCPGPQCVAHLETLRAQSEDIIALSRLDPQFTAESSPPDPAASRDPLVVTAFQVRRMQTETRGDDDTLAHVVAVPMQRADGQRSVLRVVFDLTPARAAVLDRERTVALLLLFDFVAVLAFGIFLGGRVLVSPLERLTRAVQATAARGFAGEAALPPPEGPLELARLTTAFGEMLTRLRAQQVELTTQLSALERTRDDLVRSEKVATVGRLAAGVAHEIGNPLSAVQGFVEFLRDPRGADAETQRDLLTRMARELERMQTTVRQLLDFARPSAGTPREVAVADVVRDAVELVRFQRSVRSVRLEVAPIDPALTVMADPQRLGQVLVNLLLNAGEALDGRGTIRLSAFVDADSVVRLEVADDGPGVPAALRDRLFEPFQTTKPLGTGLGLAVSQRLVEEAHGRLTFETPSGEPGARFVLCLPRTAKA